MHYQLTIKDFIKYYGLFGVASCLAELVNNIVKRQVLPTYRLTPFQHGLAVFVLAVVLAGLACVPLYYGLTAHLEHIRAVKEASAKKHE